MGSEMCIRDRDELLIVRRNELARTSRRDRFVLIALASIAAAIILVVIVVALCIAGLTR